MEDKLTIEETFAKLEELTGALEREELSMEKSFALYAEGLTLVKALRESIDEVEKKVLILEEGGTLHEF